MTQTPPDPNAADAPDAEVLTPTDTPPASGTPETTPPGSPPGTPEAPVQTPPAPGTETSAQTSGTPTSAPSPGAAAPPAEQPAAAPASGLPEGTVVPSAETPEVENVPVDAAGTVTDRPKEQPGPVAARPVNATLDTPRPLGTLVTHHQVPTEAANYARSWLYGALWRGEEESVEVPVEVIEQLCVDILFMAGTGI